MNPGMLARPARLDENLRFAVLPRKPVDVAFGYPHDGGDFSAAVRRCVGVAKCRTTRRRGGRDVPVVPGDGRGGSTPRAAGPGCCTRCSPGEVITDGWRSAEVRDALDLCLSCKGCRSDCPVGVDMATYKAEFLHHHYRGRRRPAAHYAMGRLPGWLRAAAPVRAAAVLNALAAVRPLAAAGEAAGRDRAGADDPASWRRRRSAGGGGGTARAGGRGGRRGRGRAVRRAVAGHLHRAPVTRRWAGRPYGCWRRRAAASVLPPAAGCAAASPTSPRASWTGPAR